MSLRIGEKHDCESTLSCGWSGLLFIAKSQLLEFPRAKEKKDESGAENENEKHEALDLKLFALGYHNVTDNDGTPPKNIDSLMERISSDRPIDVDNYVIIWGVDLNEFANQQNTDIAYVKDAPAKGGMRARFTDASVRKVSAEEFQKLPKAKAADFAAKPADVTTTLKQFWEVANKGALDRSYAGKTIEIKGIVREFGSSSDGIPPKAFKDDMTLTSGERYVDVRCHMVESLPWSKYAKGQQVTVKGKFGDTLRRFQC